MAKLTRPKFVVFMSDDDDGTEVAVTWADQLRGELEAAKNGIPKDAGLHLTTVWCWCVMVREHGYDRPFQEFKRDLVGIEKADEPDEPVDPTQQATTL